MFGLTQLEERLAWVALVVIVIFGFAWHERDMGAAKCQMDDAQVAGIQKAAQQAQEAADAQRLRSSQDAYQTELAALQHARDTEPAPVLVCHETRPQPVSAPTKVPDAQPAAPGPLPAGNGPDFDPAPGALAIADEADQLLAQCRELNSAVTH